jgi:hypothetical protein
MTLGRIPVIRGTNLAVQAYGVPSPAKLGRNLLVFVATVVTALSASGLATSQPRTDAPGAPAAWVMNKPDYRTQGAKSVAKRGMNPCLTPEPGFGDYREWRRGLSYGKLLIPSTLKLNERGEFDVVFHFHGSEPARKEWVQALTGAVFVGVDLGNGSGAYHAKFSEPEAFWELLAEVEDLVAARAGAPMAAARYVAISAWSAGYGAIANILRSKRAQRLTDTLILLDGLHAEYQGNGLDTAALVPFVQFAQAAAAGRKLMYLTHSSITPPGYASTTETANYLIWKLGGHPQPALGRSDPMGLERISEFHQGNFHVLGFAGGEALDHCAQLGVLRSIAHDALGPRWNLPRASVGKGVAVAPR